jgi:urease accessory protein
MEIRSFENAKPPSSVEDPAVVDTPFRDIALLRLLQLTSPALPVGAYAYSQGLEYAVSEGWVTSEHDTEQWLAGLLRHPLQYLDVPILGRLHQAWAAADEPAVFRWNAYLYASRESAELQQEDHHLGTALARLLTDLGLERAQPWRLAPRCCFATSFSLAAASWGIDRERTALGYLWAWSENQVMAATKLIPLGQTAGQRILSRLQPEIQTTVQEGLKLPDDDIGCSAAGLGIASARHETQYTRLFRS